MSPKARLVGKRKVAKKVIRKKSVKVSKSSSRDAGPPKARKSSSFKRSSPSPVMPKSKTASSVQKSVDRSAPLASPVASHRPAGVGRPKVTGEEMLYLLFKEDFPARQIFTFLRAETVKDLERHSPEEILHRVTEPLRHTIQRIRERLAAYNRCLAEDGDFLIEFQKRNGSR